jgi:hypothetical protein
MLNIDVGIIINMYIYIYYIPAHLSQKASVKTTSAPLPQDGPLPHCCHRQCHLRDVRGIGDWERLTKAFWNRFVAV